MSEAWICKDTHDLELSKKKNNTKSQNSVTLIQLMPKQLYSLEVCFLFCFVLKIQKDTVTYCQQC